MALEEVATSSASSFSRSRTAMGLLSGLRGILSTCFKRHWRPLGPAFSTSTERKPLPVGHQRACPRS